MNTDRISRRIKTAIADGVFPGAVLLCAVNQEILLHQSYGMANIFKKKRMETDSVFDLASLTKPLATTMALAKLIETKQVQIDQTIGSILNEFRASEKRDITIDMLLRHRSGLPAYREYFKQISNTGGIPRQSLRRLLVQEPLEYKINERQLYSDLGFMVLSWLIENITHQRLDRFVSKQIYQPLGIDTLFFIPDNEPDRMISTHPHPFAATQLCPWRKKILVGEVDDDNAWAAGGIEGHAGLFGDTGSVYRLCCEILNALQNKFPQVLRPGIINALVQKKDQGDMVAGFDTPSKAYSSSGRYFSKRSIGHLGFTGTSFWIDPEASLIVVFLTNRVHPLRSNEKIKKFRPELHDLIYEELM